jgi:hypothetical protein
MGGAKALGMINTMAGGAAVWGDAGGASSEHCGDVGAGCQVVAEMGPNIIGVNLLAVGIYIETGERVFPLILMLRCWTFIKDTKDLRACLVSGFHCCICCSLYPVRILWSWHSARQT